MKIKIEHIPNTFNYGSFMMAINTLHRINNEIEDVTFFVDTATEEDFNRLKLETGLENLELSPKKIIGESKISKLKCRIAEVKKDKKLYDVKIVLGGDDISEYYTKKGWRVLFPLMHWEAKKIPMILLGQSIGPFTSYRKLLARFALNKTKIYVRDTYCLEYLKELKIKTASNGRDLAFLPLPMQDKAKHILTKYKLEDVEYVTCVMSGLTKCYTSDFESYIKEQTAILRVLLNNQKLSEKKIVLLPHVIKPDHVDDRHIIREIIKKLNDEELERIIAIDDKMLASEAREILGNGIFTITGRMHAAVSTFFMRKPAISLSYSVKYGGVIGDGLSMHKLIIECDDEALWKTDSISKAVDEKVNYVLDNYSALIKKIDKNVSKTSKITEIQLDNLVKDIKNTKNSKKLRRLKK